VTNRADRTRRAMALARKRVSGEPQPGNALAAEHNLEYLDKQLAKARYVTTGDHASLARINAKTLEVRELTKRGRIGKLWLNLRKRLARLNPVRGYRSLPGALYGRTKSLLAALYARLRGWINPVRTTSR
jgi:hypothetical protein